MMKTAILGGAALLAALSIASRAQAGYHSHSHSTSTRDNDIVRSCADMGVRFDDGDTEYAESQLTIPRGEISRLDVAPSANGGVWLEGTDGSDFRITLCKAVPGGDGARARLDSITLSRHGDRLRAEGPSGEDWVAELIVRAPRDSSVALESENGPVSLSGFTGSASVASTNGPVSLRRCRGKISVDSQNGPIHVSESSGNMTLEARNGPLTVHLAGDGWSGGKLDGRTENGPVSLELSEKVGTGIRVESAGRSPFRCRGEACQAARRNWDDDHKSIEFGAAEAAVRLSTINGPVSIESGN